MLMVVVGLMQTVTLFVALIKSQKVLSIKLSNAYKFITLLRPIKFIMQFGSSIVWLQQPYVDMLARPRGGIGDWFSIQM